MARARRAVHVFFRLSEDLLPDVERLLRGEVRLTSQSRMLAVSILTGRERAVSVDEVRFLWSLPADCWTTVDELEIDDEGLDKLAQDGFVIRDEEDGEPAELRSRNERLAQSGWNPYAALYHSQTRWRDVNFSSLKPPPPPRGKPPPPFHVRPDMLEALNLPLPRRNDGLFRVLLERRTTRSFDPEAPLTRDEVGTLLYFTFGCHGLSKAGDEIVLLRKTSPAGGSLHPIEAYPLVINVDGIETGQYHYRPDRHGLDLLERLAADAARERAVSFAAGQDYLAGTQLLLILTARFSRSFWKYRSSSRALAVVLMDAAHLSQTLYLVCAELGLGAFVSAAVNAGNIEDALGLDGLEEGALAVGGCGRPAQERSPVDVEFEPYVPRETVIEP